MLFPCSDAVGQEGKALLKRVAAKAPALSDFFKHVVPLPRADDGFCSVLWRDILVAIVSNHACAGGLVKVPSLVKPVLDRLIAGGLLSPVDSSILFK